MPFDGIVIKCIVEELDNLLAGGRIDKIHQPESDEIHISVRSLGKNHRLLLSANANSPRIHLTNCTKENPAVPPVFCMLLRKHISGGKIIKVHFHDYERIITIDIEAMDELGDLNIKKLVIEIMGKHSNIILLNHANRILDAIKHIDNDISSVREIMPARPYTLPPAQDKTSPDILDAGKLLFELKNNEPVKLDKFLLNKIKGFSPMLCKEIVKRAGLVPNVANTVLSHNDFDMLYNVIEEITSKIRESEFTPCVIYNETGSPSDFHCIKPVDGFSTADFTSMSEALDEFYQNKDKAERLRQKKSDLFKVLHNNIERCANKIITHESTLKDVENRETLKLYGELITANLYNLKPGSKVANVMNYYSENYENIEIPMDENITPQQNAQKYFKLYTKAKAAYSHSIKQLEDARIELEYLQSVEQLLENAENLQDIDEIRTEMQEQGYLHNKKRPDKKQKESKPLHFITSDGYDIFVGKNNRQNDYLTLRFASSNDTWLHTKNIPGSHVIIKKKQGEIPDNILVEAAKLAAYYSKAKFSSNVPVDYTKVKNVKKPSGAKPGMVIYADYKTINVSPDANLNPTLKKDNK